MANIRFHYTNLWDAGTVTAASALAAWPAINTQHRWLTKSWRSASVAGAIQLRLDLGATGYAADFAAIRFNNLSGIGTAHIIGYTDAFTTIDYSEDLIGNNTIMALYFAATKTYRYWAIELADASPVAAYFEVGRVFLGSYIEMSRNYLGTGDDYDADPSTETKSDGGQTSSILRSHYGVRQYPFEGITATDKSNLKALFLSRGKTRDFFVCENPAYASTRTYYVKLVNEPVYTPRPGTTRFNTLLEAEDLR